MVLVPSADRARTYVFAADNAGEITDFEVLATVEGTTDAQAALAHSAMPLDHRGEMPIRQSWPHLLDQITGF